MDRYKECMSRGNAIKIMGEIMAPFIKDRELLNNIRSVQTSGEFYPLDWLLQIFNIAEDKGKIELIAKGWSYSIVRAITERRGFVSPGEAIDSIAQGFILGHKGDVGKLVTKIEEKTVLIDDSTYTPCGFLMIVFERGVTSFGAKNVRCTHLEKCRGNGSKSCQYIIEWD